MTFPRARAFATAERCAAILVDGAFVPPETPLDLPRDRIEAILVLHGPEATTALGTEGGGGAVLAFTRVGPRRP